MKIAFLLYPTAGTKISEDTSFWIIHELLRRGHDVFHFESRDLFWSEGSLRARLRRSRTRVPGGYLPADPMKTATRLAELDCIFIRKEPPFDVEYLHALQLLEALKERVFVLNDPAGIALSNEKLFILDFPGWIPDTAVAGDPDQAAAAVRAIGGRVIVKALDDKSGRGVYVTSASDPNLRSLLETATSLGRTKVMIQRFVDAWKHGDKRILLLDGEPLGAFLRRPARGGDFRANLSAGGRLERAALTPREKRMAEAMAQRLRDRGLYFTGIDVIGGFLTEINVTSPAGIADLITLERRHAERDVADFIERRAGSVLRRPLPASRPSAGRRRS